MAILGHRHRGDGRRWGLPMRRRGRDGLREGRSTPTRNTSRAQRRPHRSTSPNTISSEPRIAETSASMWPRHMKSIAWRWAKPGARILQR